MRYFLFILCAFFMMPRAGAQEENNVWAFGNHNGLNFNNVGAPPVFFQTSMESLEGCASIANATGNLLFYSNGNKVWNAAGAVMPNGDGLLGNGPAFANLPASSAQGVAMVHSPANPSQYYVFVLDAAEEITGNMPGYLRYSVVDMSLNGGSGDVIAAQKNIMLDTFMSEKMTVVKGAGCYYWLIVHRHNAPAYRAFKISATGIAPAVSSDGTWQGDFGAGQMKVSPDGTKIASCSSMTGNGIEIGNFDNATGIVSNTILIDPLPTSRLGTCFSPDNTKLYITTGGNILQYDLSTFPNAATITASKVPLASGLSFSQLRNGPDGKIYIAFFSNHAFIGTISNPNTAGPGCLLNVNALPQPAGTTFPAPGNPYGHGLGNDVLPSLQPDTTVQGSHNTRICSASGQLTAPGGCEAYVWNDGITGQSRDLSAGGTYWVYGFQECHVKVDTYHIQFVDLQLDLGPDTAICPGDSFRLDATTAGATYRWQDGSTVGTYAIGESGSYWVKISKEGCTLSDTVLVNIIPAFAKIREDNMLVCQNEPLTLHAEASPVSTYAWNTGEETPTIAVQGSGDYIVTVINICGAFADSVHITVDRCDCPSFIPNAFSPNGDQLNDAFIVFPNCTYRNFSMSIYNRFGQRIFYSRDPLAGWDGTYLGQPADAGTYFYYIRFEGPRQDIFEKKGDLTLIR